MVFAILGYVLFVQFLTVLFIHDMVGSTLLWKEHARFHARCFIRKLKTLNLEPETSNPGGHSDPPPPILPFYASTHLPLKISTTLRQNQLFPDPRISPENRFSPRGLAKVLALLAPHAGLMRATKAGSRYKTGTIDNVSTLAGFARTKKSGDVRFVISAGGGTGKLRFRLLRILEQDF